MSRPVPRSRLLFSIALFLTLPSGRALAADSPAGDARVNIRVEMSAEPQTVVIGDDITFEYRVVNTGDVALTDVTVVDRDLGPIATVGRLNPGESRSWTRQETIDASSKTRRAVVVDATAPDGQAVHAQRDVRFAIVEPATTTTAPASTTTTAATPTTITAPATTTAVPLQVLGEQATRPAPVLPRTGSPVAGRAIAGLVLLLAGLALRRRGGAGIRTGGWS